MRAIAILALIGAVALADTSPKSTVPEGVSAAFMFRSGAKDEKTGKKIELNNVRVEKGELKLLQGFAVCNEDKIGATGGSMAIEIRVKFEEISRNWALLCMRGVQNRTIGETFGLYCGAQGQLYFNANRTVAQSPNNVIKPGEWVHIVATVDKDAGQMKLYVDGREVASGNGPPGGLEEKGGPTYMGGCDQHGYHINGAMKYVRLWKKALTDKDVERLSKTR